MRNVASIQRAPLVIRLVASVVVAIGLITVLGSGLIFWRVDDSLDSQLVQDVQAYREVGVGALEADRPVPGAGRFRYQIFGLDGRQVAGNTTAALVSSDVLRSVFNGGNASGETGGFIQGGPSYVWEIVHARRGTEPVVAVFAIDRDSHNRALLALLVQLALGGLVTIGAAGWLGYRTARAALAPVERYRRAAESANGQTRLPIGQRDDELSRLGLTFNALLDRLEESQQRERRFLADASHELRAPLSLMKAEVEVALSRVGVDEERRKGTLRSLGDQVMRLETLCNALLELEELGASTTPPSQLVDVNGVLGEAASRARALLGNSTRTVRYDAGDPVFVLGNAHWLGVATNNLVSNALRYGEGEVDIGARRVGRDVEIWVSDEGPGIPEEFFPRAFERFALVDESRASGGTGLGLALVAQIVELHGAVVTITGARVAMRFPDPVLTDG